MIGTLGKLFGKAPTAAPEAPNLTTLEGDLKDHYAATAPAFNVLYGGAIDRAKRAEAHLLWERIVGAVAILGLVFALLFITRTGGNRVVAVPVNKDGVPVAAAHEVAFAADPTAAAIENRLSSCVEAIYAVSPDAIVEHHNLDEAYECVSSAAHGYLDAYYGANSGAMSPWIRGKRETAEICPTNFEGLSSQSYHVLWSETDRTFAGAVIGTLSRGATFTVGQLTGARDVSDIVANPFGIVIASITPDANINQPATISTAAVEASAGTQC